MTGDDGVSRAIGPLLAATLDAADEALVTLDPSGHVAHLNRSAERVIGQDRAAALGKSVSELFDGGPGFDAPERLVRASAEGLSLKGVVRPRLGSQPLGYELRPSPGDVRCAVLRLELSNPSDDEARYRRLFHDSPIALCEQDFSGVKAYLDELTRSGITDLPAHLRAHPEAVLAAARRVRFIEVNAALLNVYEATSREEILSSWPVLFGAEMGRVFLEELEFLIQGKETTFSAHCATRTLRGRRNEIHFRLTVLPGSEKTWDRLVASIFDMTAYYEAERRLRATLREKDVLLKEVHHRVKNNLQVISSLLNLGAQHVTEGTARAVFASSQSRVQSIALVHEKLYRSKDLSHVRFGEYVQTLITELLYSHSAAERGISADVEIDELPLPVNLAIPCGLIVNELVSNSLKHAFPASREGKVTVRARRATEGGVELAIEDDGRGLPSGFDPRKSHSLGLDLVFTFADQLGARVDIRGYPGTKFVFAFREDHP